MKKYIFPLALIMVLMLGAYPKVAGESAMNSPVLDDSGLALQILNSRNGIFCLSDPKLKESYLPGEYRWRVHIISGNETWTIETAITSPSGNSEGKTEHRIKDAALRTFYKKENNEVTDAFQTESRVLGTNLYFDFTIPENFDFDLSEIESFCYEIISEPDNTHIENYVGSEDIVVADINSGTVYVPSCCTI